MSRSVGTRRSSAAAGLAYAMRHSQSSATKPSARSSSIAKSRCSPSTTAGMVAGPASWTNTARRCAVEGTSTLRRITNVVPPLLESSSSSMTLAIRYRPRPPRAVGSGSRCGSKAETSKPAPRSATRTLRRSPSKAISISRSSAEPLCWMALAQASSTQRTTSSTSSSEAQCMRK